MNVSKKEEYLNTIRNLFVEDYSNINSSKESVNKYLEIFEIEGYDYNTFCSSLLNGIGNYLDTISDDNTSNINLTSEIKLLLINLILDKVKKCGSSDLIDLLSTYEKIFKENDNLI